jgi:hypothetical protein
MSLKNRTMRDGLTTLMLILCNMFAQAEWRFHTSKKATMYPLYLFQLLRSRWQILFL